MPESNHQPFGSTGLLVPPITFRATFPDIPDSTRRLICGEWFRQASSPVAIELHHDDADLDAVKQLGRALRQFEIRPEEIVTNLILRRTTTDSLADVGTLHHIFDDACRALGPRFNIQLVTLDLDAFTGSEGTSVVSALNHFKSSGRVAAIGLRTSNVATLQNRRDGAAPDFIHLVGQWTVLHQPIVVADFLAGCDDQHIPVICSGVLESGFLVGGPLHPDRAISRSVPIDGPFQTWRKAFTSLCHGHGVRPAHACVQFALRTPAIATVSLATSRVDRVAENVSYATQPVPGALWDSMHEEGLLAEA